MGFIKSACRSVLQAALKALGPEPQQAPARPEVRIKRVEIRFSDNTAPGRVARDVAERLAAMRRRPTTPPS